MQAPTGPPGQPTSQATQMELALPPLGFVVAGTAFVFQLCLLVYFSTQCFIVGFAQARVMSCTPDVVVRHSFSSTCITPLCALAIKHCLLIFLQLASFAWMYVCLSLTLFLPCSAFRLHHSNSLVITCYCVYMRDWSLMLHI